MQTVSEVLASRPYPGRGCLAARTTDGTLCFAYFLTGRSPASLNRELSAVENGDLVVADTGGTGIRDALRHYTAATRRGRWVVVGNGDQVPPLAAALADGVPLFAAWGHHTYEPDAPLFTSRIWIAREVGAEHDCVIGFARRSHRGDGDVDRVAWALSTIGAGTGVLMTTYDGTTGRVRSTTAPAEVEVNAHNRDELLREEIWPALDPALRVAAAVLTPDDPADPPLIVHRRPGVAQGPGEQTSEA